jgi:ubiquinone/menaquinone biosynthesis C-methylase UbiE
VSHQDVNRALWDGMADQWVERAKRDWADPDPSWGIWRIPEADVGALPDVDGLDAIELGCGTAYFSAWLARRGARPVGVDQSKGQLATARAMQAEHGIEFPLIEADAEDVPLPDASFDFALSEYGASLWCRPERWIAEASRLLRPAGDSSS